jgi:hypothetical protein
MVQNRPWSLLNRSTTHVDFRVCLCAQHWWRVESFPFYPNQWLRFHINHVSIKGPNLFIMPNPRPWFFWNELGILQWLNSSRLNSAISKIYFFESFSSPTEPRGFSCLSKVLHGFLRVSSQYPILWKTDWVRAFQHRGAQRSYAGYISLCVCVCNESTCISHRITMIHIVSRYISPLRLVQRPWITCVHGNHTYLYPFLYTRHTTLLIGVYS